MDYKPEWKGRINQKDEDGCTVLHVVAAHSPGYLIKRKWQHCAGGVGLVVSGLENHKTHYHLFPSHLVAASEG